MELSSERFYEARMALSTRARRIAMTVTPKKPTTPSVPKGAGALDKGLSLLARICDAASPPRFVDLLRETGMPKATLHRMLGALLAHRLIALDPHDQTYGVGLRALEMAQRSWEGMDLRRAAID